MYVDTNNVTLFSCVRLNKGERKPNFVLVTYVHAGYPVQIIGCGLVFSKLYQHNFTQTLRTYLGGNSSVEKTINTLLLLPIIPPGSPRQMNKFTRLNAGVSSLDSF